MDLDFYLRASTRKKTRNWKTALVQKGLFLENPKSKFQNTKYKIKILCDRLQM